MPSVNCFDVYGYYYAYIKKISTTSTQSSYLFEFPFFFFLLINLHLCSQVKSRVFSLTFFLTYQSTIKSTSIAFFSYKESIIFINTICRYCLQLCITNQWALLSSESFFIYLKSELGCIIVSFLDIFYDGVSSVFFITFVHTFA